MADASPTLPGGGDETPSVDPTPDLYRALVEDSRDGIWVFDLDGRVRYANPRVSELLGVPLDSVADLTVFDTLDEAGRVQFAEHLAELRAGRLNTHEVEVQFVRRDGSVLWLLVQESPWWAPDGSLAGIVHRMSDDTRRRAIIEALRTSQAELAEAERIARIGGWTWDVDSDRITCSEHLIELFGFTPETAPQTFAGYLEIVHPDDRDRVRSAVEAALTGGDDLDYTARVALTDGWRWVRARGLVRRDTDAVMMTGTHQDVTEVTEAQLALVDQVLQNTLMQAVASAANEAGTLDEVLARARDLVLLHDDWERARGFIPDGEGALSPLYVSAADQRADEAHPARRHDELELARRVLRERQMLWDEHRLTIGFPVLLGTEVCAVVTLTSAPPLYRHDMIESMVGQVAVQLGRVAERERAQRELADARDQAMAASRQKSEFLATMSHEIRTPLNGVIGLTDLLVRTDLDPAQQRLVSGVQVASRALLALINDVLDFSKIEAGRLELEQVDFDVREVFDHVARLLGEQARGKELELLVDVDPGLPAVLRGDPTRLTQVLTNLASNAVKFTERGQVVLTAGAENGPDGRVLLHVDVRDTGIGIDPRRLPELFEPFTQGDASTTRIHGGTGLGLAISREIVTALGGELTVHSESGAGSTFSFTVPCEPPEVEPAPSADDRARERLAGRRVLVLDGRPARARVLVHHLARWGLEVDLVADEAAARAAVARGTTYQAVLAATEAPDREAILRGGEFLRSLGPERPVLLLISSAADGPDEWRAAGADDVVSTPVVGADLRQTLLRLLVGDGTSGQPAAPPPAPVSSTRRGRVLVVEDNEVNQMVAAGILESLGYAVETADDGRAATEIFAVRRYDAILMDVQMPHMDGYTATRAIRAQEPPGRRVPVIAMTASAVEGERERCLDAGMDDFLTKPVDPATLASVLHRWLSDQPSEPRGSVQPHRPPPPSPQPPEEPSVPDAAAPDPLSGLDLDRLAMLRDLDPDNTAYLDRAIGNFCRNSVTAVETISAAIDADDAAALRAAANKPTGSALNLGVAAAGAAARELEFLGDANTTEGATTLVPPLETALEEGRRALRTYQRRFTDAGRELPSE